MRRLPIISATAAGVAVVAAVVQYTVPAAAPTLQRGDFTLVTSGEWWRLVTPLLVQTLGWYQVVTNLVTLALVGAVAERSVGGARWAVLFAAGTIGGQVAAYAWGLPGGGDSIAICGLAGGMVVRLLAGPAANRWPAAVVVCYVAALTGWGFGGIPAAGVAGIVAAVAVFALPSPRFALLAAVGGAVALAAHADLHGVSLLSGMVAGIFCLGGALSGRRASREGVAGYAV
ncbi:rhomboid family intramembrane serine protease [Actinophytocola sp.]|uniref:rhomboid family intramembrane serine protease n=1 Tax=Actinophytocola sp. TaxID=1872138 RepID=UPI002D63F8BA|nr:rhomboid family intramembrane serine protease [Actinophytocola sp.]HYQ67027.1 rhomboid family intramembrane serine protease [Actinophytocola sp.]